MTIDRATSTNSAAATTSTMVDFQSLMAQCPHLSNLSVDEAQQLLSQFSSSDKQEQEISNHDDVEKSSFNQEKQEEAHLQSSQTEVVASCPYGFDKPRAMNASHQNTNDDDDPARLCPYMKDMKKAQIDRSEFKCNICDQFIVDCVTLTPCHHSYCAHCYQSYIRSCNGGVNDKESELSCKICKCEVKNKLNDQFKQFLVDSYINTLYPTVALQFQFALQQSDVHRSIHYARKALEIHASSPLQTENSTADNEELLGVLYGKLADWSQMTRQFDDARHYYHNSVDQFLLNDQLYGSMYITMIKLSDLLLYGMNNAKEAEKWLLDALELCQKHEMHIEALNANVKRSDALMKQGRKDEAMEVLKESNQTVDGLLSQSQHDSATITKANQIKHWILGKLLQHSSE